MFAMCMVRKTVIWGSRLCLDPLYSLTLVPVQFFYSQPVRQIQALTLKATDIAFWLSLFLFSLFCSVTTLSNLIFLSVFSGLSPLTSPPSVHVHPPCPLSL